MHSLRLACGWLLRGCDHVIKTPMYYCCLPGSEVYPCNEPYVQYSPVGWDLMCYNALGCFSRVYYHVIEQIMHSRCLPDAEVYPCTDVCIWWAHIVRDPMYWKLLCTATAHIHDGNTGSILRCGRPCNWKSHVFQLPALHCSWPMQRALYLIIPCYWKSHVLVRS